MSMLLSTWQPTQKNLWRISIDGTPAYNLAEDWFETGALPSWTHDEPEINYMNERKYMPGKIKYDSIKFDLRDPIVEQGAANLRNWCYIVYDPATGRGNYAALAKKNITLSQVDPAGNVIREWMLEGSWPQKAEFGGLDYKTSDPVLMSVTIRFDKAHLMV